MPFGTNLGTDINHDDIYRDDEHKGYPAMPLAKSTVWMMRAVMDADQLRQRIAWALSQIVVIGYGVGTEAPEPWLSYYDIMVRNALGNYQDVIREVTFSPLMGMWLTHTLTSWPDYNGYHPNENYAREIMQLFTIGLFELNEDGSPLTNKAGDSIETYGPTNIEAHA